jgi:hypothetical protein
MVGNAEVIERTGLWEILCCAQLFPDGLRFSQEAPFFEPGNVLLMSIMHEMNREIPAERVIGVGDGN